MQDDKNNQLIEVPDFKTLSDFSIWVESLKEKEIQSWRAKDWNKMYEKLFTIIDKSPEIKAQILKEQYMREDGSPITIDDMPAKYLTKFKRKNFSNSDLGKKALAKLYKNYRMEPAQIKKIYDLAVEAGEKAAATGEVSTARMQFLEDLGIKSTTDSIEKIVYEQSSYPESLEKLGYDRYCLRAKVKIKKNTPEDIKNGTLNNGVTVDIQGIPEITIKKVHKYSDVPIETIFHESAHAHLQVRKDSLVDDKLKEIKPIDGLDDDFVQLLSNNESLYYYDKDPFKKDNLLVDFIQVLVNALDKKTLSEQEINDLITNAQSENTLDLTKQVLKLININEMKATKQGRIHERQPLEYFAHLYGYIATRSFRRASGQYSERGIPLALKYLSKELGEPSEVANDEKGNIVFKFYKECLPELQNLFTGKDNPLNGEIEINRGNDETTICMKQIFFAENKWKEWEKKVWQPFERKRAKVLKCFQHIAHEIEEKDILPDEHGNIVVHSIRSKLLCLGDKQKFYQYLFNGKNNPMNNKIRIVKKDEEIQYIISNDKDILGALNKWQNKVWKPLLVKAEEFAKAFTSKNNIHSIDVGEGGCADINFDKNLPYTNGEIIKKVYGIDVDRLSFKDKIKIKAKMIINSEAQLTNIGERNITTPPVYSQEFDRLLSLFKKDKIGWIEAEQKRDAIKRYRRIKFKRITRRMGLGVHKD